MFSCSSPFPTSYSHSYFMHPPTFRLLSSSLSNCSRTQTKSKIPVIFTSRNMSTGIPSETAMAQKQQESQPNAGIPSTSELGIENTNISTAAGVELDAQQKTLVGSVLDVSYSRFPIPIDTELTSLQLFAGRPSLKKLQLWNVSTLDHL